MFVGLNSMFRQSELEFVVSIMFRYIDKMIHKISSILIMVRIKMKYFSVTLNTESF